MMNPYKVLNVNKNFTLQELKNNYKSIALQYHPDKNKKNIQFAEYQIKVITLCYKLLIEEFTLRTNQPDHHTLKNASLESFKKSPPNPCPKMDNETFNHFFEKNSIKDDSEDGYAKWMQQNDPNKYKNETNTMITKKFDEPMPYMVGSKHIDFHELGNDVNNFSANSKNLQFMDYRIAHTTSNIIDEHDLKYNRSFNTLNEIENARESQNFDMSEDDMIMLEKKKQEHDKKEQLRKQKIHDYDQKITLHHMKVMNTLKTQ